MSCLGFLALKIVLFILNWKGNVFAVKLSVCPLLSHWSSGNNLNIALKLTCYYCDQGQLTLGLWYLHTDKETKPWVFSFYRNTQEIVKSTHPPIYFLKPIPMSVMSAFTKSVNLCSLFAKQTQKYNEYFSLALIWKHPDNLKKPWDTDFEEYVYMLFISIIWK